MQTVGTSQMTTWVMIILTFLAQAGAVVAWVIRRDRDAMVTREEDRKEHEKKHERIWERLSSVEQDLAQRPDRAHFDAQFDRMREGFDKRFDTLSCQLHELYKVIANKKP